MLKANNNFIWLNYLESARGNGGTTYPNGGPRILGPMSPPGCVIWGDSFSCDTGGGQRWWCRRGGSAADGGGRSRASGGGGVKRRGVGGRMSSSRV